MKTLRTFWMVWKAVRSADKAGRTAQEPVRAFAVDDLRTTSVGFVVLSASPGADALTAIQLMAAAIEIAKESSAVIGFYASGVIAFTFGTHTSVQTSSPLDSPKALAQAFAQRLSSEVRVVHGVVPGATIAFDPRLPFPWTFFVPRFDEVLKTLLSLTGGTVYEWGAA